MKRTHILLAGISFAALGHSAARAQDAAAPVELAAADIAPGDQAIADIVVTAEKHQTTIQTAPLAITAVGGDQLRERNLNQVTDLNGYVPGLNIAKSEGAERIITIRGIGYETAQNPNSQPGVAFHIDGVYVANVLALNQDLLDVDRVEVLRGPQGTVFGETSTGGAINVITRKPVIGEASGTASVSGGNYNLVKGIATVNIPIGETIAMRASAQFLKHSPYGYATAVPGRRRYGFDDAFNLGLRASMIWKPTDRFTALLEGQHFYQDRSASLQKDVTDPDPRKRYVTQDLPATFRIRTDMIYLTLTQELGDRAALKSVSAYQYLDKHQTADNDRLASPFYFDHVIFWRDRSKTFTQEISLSSVGEQKLEYVVGGFYLRQRALQKIFEVISPFAAAVVLPDGTGVKFQTDSPYQHTSLAGYGNATVHLGDKLNLIAGARYNYDRITAQPFQYFNIVPPKKAISREVTGKVGAEYRLTSQNMVYATGSHGYKPTGLNFNTPGIFTKDSFEKETVNAVEVGTKNDFADHRVRLNLAGYYYWYKGLQVNAADPIPFTDGTVNIPRARIYGAEAEFSVLPFGGFRIDGNVSYGHGKLKGDYLAIDAQTAASIRSAQYAALSANDAALPPGQRCNFFCPFNPAVIGAVFAGAQNTNGNKVPKLPTWQGEVTPSYTVEALGGKVTLRGDIIYRGKFNYRIFAVAALDRVPSYTLYNAFIAYEPDNKPWSVSVAVQNLTNKAGINSKFSDPYGSGTTSVEYIDPRQVLGTVNFRF